MFCALQKSNELGWYQLYDRRSLPRDNDKRNSLHVLTSDKSYLQHCHKVTDFIEHKMGMFVPRLKCGSNGQKFHFGPTQEAMFSRTSSVMWVATTPAASDSSSESRW